MKIVVIGGTGLIGSKVVAKLRQQNHAALAASPDTGVNTLTGEGLRPELRGADVVVAISYSIVHSTLFFEVVKTIAASSTVGDTIHLAPVLIQPMAAEDVANVVTSVAIGAPLNATMEIAGPEQLRLDELIRRSLAARHDPRKVIADPAARLYGASLTESILVPGSGARLGTTRFDEWLALS